MEHTRKLQQFCCLRRQTNKDSTCSTAATSQLPLSHLNPQMPFLARNLPSHCSGKGSFFSFIALTVLQVAKYINRPEKSWTCLQQGVGVRETLCCVNRPQVFDARTAFLILLKKISNIYIYVYGYLFSSANFLLCFFLHFSIYTPLNEINTHSSARALRLN